ncbi:MAG: DUF1844 domain-containing protein [Deltaproteobacteria bacterium]|nr:DUF1844 domain-containing protein [Deltaproteobacteria bacterium]MBW2638924.1 DUF1844 domain-containing protein [Deltaproteobacteria bacterium]MBW2680122.1 DUF1844 domain-containing protein [Deltaproteobacteria bacterium]
MFAEGDPEKQDQETKEESAKPSKEGVEASESEEAAAPEEEPTDYQLPKINFATFIFSLNSSVLAQLGLIDDPVTGKKTKHLPLAKQTIDILSMMEEKTRGNLTKDEETMLKNILYDLRMLYVKEKG